MQPLLNSHGRPASTRSNPSALSPPAHQHPTRPEAGLGCLPGVQPSPQGLPGLALPSVGLWFAIRSHPAPWVFSNVWRHCHMPQPRRQDLCWHLVGRGPGAANTLGGTVGPCTENHPAPGVGWERWRCPGRDTGGPWVVSWVGARWPRCLLVTAGGLAYLSFSPAGPPVAQPQAGRPEVGPLDSRGNLGAVLALWGADPRRELQSAGVPG